MTVHATFKIIIVGDSGVGKTTLIKRYLTGRFEFNLQRTIGVDIGVKYLEVEGMKVRLQIWDFAGQSRFNILFPNYIRGSSGVIFMYDITRRLSLENLNKWATLVKENLIEKDFQIPKIIVGGKSDLHEKREIFNEETTIIAKLYNYYGMIESSSKTGQNVDKIFEVMVRKLMQNAGLTAVNNKSLIPYC